MLVFKARRLLYHSNLGSRVTERQISDQKAEEYGPEGADGSLVGHVVEKSLGSRVLVVLKVSATKVDRYKATWKGKFQLPWRKAGLLKSSR